MDRPSFQAPTRASLARSHPEILQRTISRSPTRSPQKPGQHVQRDGSEAKLVGLRDRKALRPSLSITGSPIGSSKKASRSPMSVANRRSSLQAFAVPPRRVSRRIVPSDLMFQSPLMQRKKEEPTITNTPDDQLASELGSATGDVHLQGGLEQISFQEEFEEPDLPPTPTQLGLEKPPGRPSGMLSSSPTVQHTKLGRRQDDTLQSPSKLRTVDYNEDVESHLRSGILSGRALFPEPVLKKRKLRQQLSAQMQQLKDELSELESWSGSLSQDGESTDRDLRKLISLLASHEAWAQSTPPQTANQSTSSLISILLPFAPRKILDSPQEPLPRNPFTLDKRSQTTPHLTTFAPLNLVSRSSTTSTQEMNIVTERHTFTLSPPYPFPSKIFNISVIYNTNPETQSVISVEVPAVSSLPELPECLRRWISFRLTSPLMKLDVSGLCWGINRYWEATLLRARVWSQIESQRTALVTGSRKLIQPAYDQNSKFYLGNLTKTDLSRILPHLERTSMLFESNQGELNMLLSCEISIDEWTCEPRLMPSISLSTPSTPDGVTGRRIEQEAKRLFHAVLSENGCNLADTAGDIRGDALVEATECVLDILFGAGVDHRVSEE